MAPFKEKHDFMCDVIAAIWKKETEVSEEEKRATEELMGRYIRWMIDTTKGEVMVEITEKEIKEHLDNLMNALYALSPSRNYVLQFLDLLPKDYPRMVEAYPHLFKNDETRDILKEILGIRIGETVELGGYGTLGNKLQELSNSVRSNLIGSSDLAEARKKLSEYLGRDIPNVEWEIWEQKVEMAVLEPDYGTDCMRILRLMLDKGEGDQRLMSVEDVIVDTGMDESRLLRVKNFLAKEIKILEERDREFGLTSELARRTDLIQKHIGG